jgi:hypothetical protein
MTESVAVAKDADAKKGVSPTRSDNSIHRVRDEPERQLGSLRDVIDNIRRDGGTPSVESIATELSSMHTAQRAPVLMALQQTHGNRYVQRVVAGIQAKLVVGQPGDVYEQEADRVADEVMRMPEPEVQRRAEEEEKEKEELIQTNPIAEQITPLVQRQAEEEEEEEEEEELIQTKAHSSQATEVTYNIESRIQSLKGGGQPLSEPTRAFFEPRFRHNFGQVCIHTNAEADTLNRLMNARAFTTGQDIFLRQGEYNTGSSSGRKLLAHELTHVVQQAKSLQRYLIHREMGPVVPATNQQRREFIQEAIRFLNQAAEFYPLQRQTDQARMDRTFDGITSTYTNNENIINTYLNRDAALKNSLKQAYQNALRNLLQNGAGLLNIPLKDLYFRYVDRIPSWAWPDFSQTQGQVQINGTVGLDGNNAPDDVRAVQQRLVELGYLTPQEFVAERPAAQPVQGGQAPPPIDIATIPRTMNAIRRFSQAAFGRPTLIITPAQASLTFLNAPLSQPLGRVDIAADVGRGGTNNPADVRAVQQRLRAINLLSQVHLQAELVAADARNVNENAIQNTIQAIARLHRELAGSNLWIIRPDSREEELLNNPPPRFRTQAMEFSNSVGQAQHNAPADVRLLQDRLLNLNYLTQAHFDAEVIDPANAANPARIPDNQIQQTIAALISFQVSMSLNGNGQIVLGSETHRMLICPTLPTARAGNLNAPVGVGGGGRANINQPADVRMVQERLHELGFLSSADFLSERADPAAGGNIAVAQLAGTIDAIRAFQGLVVGRTDGNIDPGGMSLRILNDPTYGTLTTFNPEANNPHAGIAFGGAGGQALNRIIQAVEQAEAGNRTGEVPAALINAAGVPASFGAGQMIGGTALGVLRNPANNQLRDQYGLDMATLNTINDRATETRNRYNAIYRLVGVGGVTDANLQALYSAYITANGAQFHTDTGLFDQDIINMFRIAQIRRMIIAHPVPNGRQPDTTVVNPADVNPAVIALLANAHFSASYSALGFNRSSLRAYVRRTASMGENRAGFVTKAIFSHPDSQSIRNAMTDASGAAIGRVLIQQNFNDANAVVPAGQANRDRVVAAVAAILHNRGGTAQNHFNNLANTLADNYVGRVLAIWDNL